MGFAPEDPKANVQRTFAGSDCRRAQARRQGVLHRRIGPEIHPRLPGLARVELMRVKSTRKG